MKEYLKDRAKEPSTWRGLIMLVGSLVGTTFSPDAVEAAILLAMALSGGNGILTKG